MVKHSSLPVADVFVQASAACKTLQTGFAIPHNLTCRLDPLLYRMEESSKSIDQPAAADASLLPEDLVIEILSRVPYGSLCRFKCVSRSWLTLCSDPDIRNKSPQTLSGFFYRRYSWHHRSSYLQQFTNVSGRGRPMIDPSLPFLPISEEINIVDCCNGLLLCQYTSPQHDYEYIVCNPTTEKWTKLPKTEAMDYVNTITLGFDPAVSSHFRVFLLAQDIILDQDPNMYHGAGVEIYSSETGRWTYRQSEWGDLPKLHPCIRKKSVFLNGVMHFPVIGSSLLAVDMEGKTWRKIPTPNQTCSSFLGLCQGRLYSVHIDHNNDDTQLSVWVLEDYSGEQWTLKHYVTLEPSERRHLEFEGGNGVIAIHPERELVFLTLGRQCNLISFDVESRTAHDICSLGDLYDIPCLPYVPSFSEWLSDGNE